MTATQTDTRKATAAKIAKDYDLAVGIDELRNLFPIGSTVSTVLRHVSSSGMSRSISVLHADSTGDISDVTWIVARVTGNKIDPKHGGIKMGGCGMDMGFALVYGMSRTIYRDSFYCTGTNGYDSHEPTDTPRCPANDHVNERMADSNYSTTRLHSDAGYALNQRWI
jgi:hypothetical protein